MFCLIHHVVGSMNTPSIYGDNIFTICIFVQYIQTIQEQILWPRHNNPVVSPKQSCCAIWAVFDRLGQLWQEIHSQVITKLTSLSFLSFIRVAQSGFCIDTCRNGFTAWGSLLRAGVNLRTIFRKFGNVFWEVHVPVLIENNFSWYLDRDAWKTFWQQVKGTKKREKRKPNNLLG